MAKRKKSAKKPTKKTTSKSKNRSKVNTKKQPQQEQKYQQISRYNTVLKILSSYKREGKIDFKGQNFNKIASKIYQNTKNFPLKQIEINIDTLFVKHSGLIDEGIDKEMMGLQVIDYFNLDDQIFTIASNIDIIIDNSIYPQVESFEGKAGELTQDKVRSIVRQINKVIQPLSKELKRSGTNVYVPSQEGNTIVFTLKASSEEEEYVTEIPEIPDTPISKPKIQEGLLKTQKELKEEVEKLKLEVEKLKKAKSKPSKAVSSQNKKLKKDVENMKKEMQSLKKQNAKMMKMMSKFLKSKKNK